KKINISDLLNNFVQNVSGNYFWNENIKLYNVTILNKQFKLEKIPIIEALMICFQDIYFDSKKIWNRIFNFSFPLTIKSYRISQNIKNIRNIFKQMVNDENNIFIKYFIKENTKYKPSSDSLLDDIITTTSSGLNIIKLSIMSIIWHLYDEKNIKWKIDILKEIQMIKNNDYRKLVKCKILNAFIYEVFRYESSFSLLNNQVINDFDLNINNNIYKIKKGTMIMSNAYVIHHNNSSWKETNNLNIFDPSRFINNNHLKTYFYIPFGKGIRECP
ncbi:25018_t:CDS:1, partial [Cetraspora pellucida]